MTIASEQVERMLPLYQGMMTTFYDHRNADVVRSQSAKLRQNQPRYLSDAEKADGNRVAQPQYWVRESLLPEELPGWYVAFSDVTSPTNERTLVPLALPRVGVNHKLPLMLPQAGEVSAAALLACISSFVVDYLARQKVGGTSMTYFYVRQFPVLPPERFLATVPWTSHETVVDWLAPRVAELVSTATDLVVVAEELEVTGAPFGWDPVRRSSLRAEIDATMFHLYGIERDDVDYIMDTFPIVKRKDEAAYGEYRTKRLILDVYDQMAEAIATGTPYASPFDTPIAEG